MPDEPLLSASALTRTYSGVVEVHALRGVDLSVTAGEMVAVMGPSGSGKSTLLSLLGGLDVPTSGSVLVGGRDLATMSPDERAAMRRAAVGYIFQDLNLMPSLSAIENVALVLELDGQRPRQAARQAHTALERVGITELADRVPAHMSGGQQQRVAIARALVGGRRIILGDELTGSLDSVTSTAVMSVLRDVVDDGAGAVIVTHDAACAAWADRIVTLRDGQIDGQVQALGVQSLLDGRS